MQALIGSTGFVGGTLAAQDRFDAAYHSTNIHDIDGRHFDRVVCAGVSAVKWWANANPEADLSGIERLICHLDRVDVDQFVMISTVDVYAVPVRVDERDVGHAPGLHAYGRNRVMLENWVRARFRNAVIIRLPALFGAGLKKNALFDLMNGNRLSAIDPASTFQWYPLERLSDDIRRVEAAALPLVNLVTEPVAMATIRSRLFPDSALGGVSTPGAYDVRTIHGDVFGTGSDYMMPAGAVMDAMDRFVGRERGP